MLHCRLPDFYSRDNLATMKKIIPIYRDFQAASPCSFDPRQNRRRVTLSINKDTDPAISRLYKKAMLAFGYESSLLPNAMIANDCTLCNACIQIRIVVPEYKFSARERKVLHKNKRLKIAQETPSYSAEQYDIYLRHYNAHRDKFKGGTFFTEKEYEQFIIMNSRTQIIRDPDNGSLKSALYYDDYGDTLYGGQQIYDPALSGRSSIGHLGILKLIEFAQQRGDIKHLYIGYWVKDSPTLDYKKRYHALEAFIDGEWVTFDPDKHTQGPRLPLPSQLAINLP